MNAARLSSASVALASVAALFVLASTAHADGTSSPGPTQRLLDSLIPSLPSEVEPPLPARMSLRDKEQDENELREAHRIDFGDVRSGRQKGKKAPIIDFSHFEMGGYTGVVAFSSDFEADPSFVAGITARVPVPAIPLGDWGIFAQAFASYIKRDLPFYYSDKAGTWFGAEVGGDYTFIRDNVWYLRGQVGILYANWNGINALDDGVGILLGAQVGFYWIRHNQNAGRHPHAAVQL
jgi:hypothetical protein